jgi:hypothetical protein
VHRDWSAPTKGIGPGVTAGGALIGAALGFGASQGLLAPISAMIGGVVGANLTLLVLNWWWNRQRRDRFIGATPKALVARHDLLAELPHSSW